MKGNYLIQAIENIFMRNYLKNKAAPHYTYPALFTVARTL